MKLYSYFRSSASYRVRIALNLKGITVDQLPVNLLKGEQGIDGYRAINPQMLLPTLVTDDGHALPQSLAIIEYLNDVHPEPALLPENFADRAWVRALSLAIACEIAPINNLSVLKYLTGVLGVSEKAKLEWYRHWTNKGLAAVEAMLADSSRTGVYCYGKTPTLADCCLVPQVFNARRFECDLTPYPTVRRIAEHCEAQPAFHAASPDLQPDAV